MPACVLSAIAVPDSALGNFPSSLLRPLRRADDLTRLAALSAVKSVELYSFWQGLKGEKGGLFVGTGFGPLETNFHFLDSLQENGEAQASPTLFSHSGHNTVAGYVSRLLDIRGPGLTITTFTWPFLSALTEALDAIERGMVRYALVIGVEVRIPFLEDMYRHISGRLSETREYGAVSWLLGNSWQGDEPPVCIVDGVKVTERPSFPHEILTRDSENWSQGGEDLKGPMAYAFALTESLSLLQNNISDSIYWKVVAAFGNATVGLSNTR